MTLSGSSLAAKHHSAEKQSAHTSSVKPKKAIAAPSHTKSASVEKRYGKAAREVSEPEAKKVHSRHDKAAKVEPERPVKTSRTAHSKREAVAEKRHAQPIAEPVEPQRAVVLQKPETPTRTEHGCSGANGTLAAVGQVMKSEGKTYRCQKTWDYNEGKLVGYPAWVELFMPTPGWGAGLKETSAPPAGAVLAGPGAKARVAPLSETQPAISNPEVRPADGVSNQLY